MKEEQQRHLEFIQNVITRMASNSFLLKGWSVTLVAALFALSATGANGRFVWIALLPAIVFWALDAYFLRQERLFRKLYDAVRAKEETDFSMDTSPFEGEVAGWLAVAFSTTLRLFHGAIVVAVVVAILAQNWSTLFTKGG